MQKASNDAETVVFVLVPGLILVLESGKATQSPSKATLKTRRQFVTSTEVIQYITS